MAETILDLTRVAPPRQLVKTSAGTWPLRRISELGLIDRTRVATAMAEAEKLAREIQDGTGRGAGMGGGGVLATLAEAGAELAVHEDVVLGVALPDASPHQIGSLTAPERAGVMSAFLGASDEEALKALAAVREMTSSERPTSRRRTGGSSSRGSSGSSAARRATG